MLGKARLMGIVNVTPDSFFPGSRCLSTSAAIARGQQLVADGADLLDIGGESSRPGATAPSEAEELDRVLPVISALAKSVAIPLSIDTRRPRVAEACVKAGASLINDITGFTQAGMREVAASCAVDLCVMHMLGDPLTMQQSPTYPEGVVEALLRWFEIQINLLIRAGVKQERIILDPGIGFGKTVAHNVEILQNLPRFKAMGYPLLIGISRKSFLSRLTGKTTEELLPATIAVNTLALRNGVDILRVHDVAEHRGIIDLVGTLETKL